MIEPAVSVERILLAILVDAYDEEVVAERERTVLRLHPQIAPVKAAILPLIGKSEDMVAKARALYEELRRRHFVEYDDSGAIGRRYRRQDEIGTPFAFTIDDQTLEDDTITDPRPRLAGPGAAPDRRRRRVPRRRARAALGDAQGRLAAATPVQLAEEVRERVGDRLAQHERERVADDAAAGRVVGRPVEARARSAFRIVACVPAHLLRAERRREREHELLARRVERAGGAVQPREREALHRRVDRAEEAALAHAAASSCTGSARSRLAEADRAHAELDGDQRHRGRAEQRAATILEPVRRLTRPSPSSRSMRAGISASSAKSAERRNDERKRRVTTAPRSVSRSVSRSARRLRVGLRPAVVERLGQVGDLAGLRALERVAHVECDRHLLGQVDVPVHDHARPGKRGRRLDGVEGVREQRRDQRHARRRARDGARRP